MNAQKDNSFKKNFLGNTLGETLQSLGIIAKEKQLLRLHNVGSKLLRQYLQERADPNVKGSIPESLLAFSNVLLTPASTNEARTSLGNKIREVVNRMPTAGESLQRINYLYNELYGNNEKQSLFSEPLAEAEKANINNFFETLRKIIFANLLENDPGPISSVQNIKDWLSECFGGKRIYEAVAKTAIYPDIDKLVAAIKR